MTIFFMILKIIGCILLAVLLLLVLLIILLLFVPIRYHVSANLEDETGVLAGVSWLLHLAALTGVYEDGKFRLTLRILFFRKQLMDTEQAEEAAEEGKEQAEESLKKAAEEVTDDSNLWEMPQDENQKVHVTDISNTAEECNNTTDGVITDDIERITTGDADDLAAGNAKKPAHNNTGKSAEQTHRKKRREKGIPVFVQLAQEFIQRIKELWKDARNVIDKINNIRDDAACRSAFAHLKEELFRLLKMFWPRKLRMNLQFSAGAPDKTGQISGICAMFPVAYSRGNVLTPDFEAEKAYAKGYANLKGRVYLYQVVGIAIRIISDKNCRRLLRRIQDLRS